MAIDPSYNAWARDRIVLYPTLVVPLRALWIDYQWFCKQWAFKPVPADFFVKWIELEEGVEIRDRNRGFGSIGRAAHGVGIKPPEAAYPERGQLICT